MSTKFCKLACIFAKKFETNKFVISNNNIALIAKGYPSDVTRKSDGLIRFLREFLASCDDALEMYREMDLPVITAEIIDECLDEIPIEVDRDYVRDFILNGQARVNEIIGICENQNEDDDNTFGLML